MPAPDRVQHLAQVVSAFVAQDGAVAWVGAGLSQAVGYLSWEGTVERLCTACAVSYPQEPSVQQLMDAAEKCRLADLEAYRAVLMELFGSRPQALQRDAYLYLARLGLAGYLTTNFDSELLEAARLAPERGFKEVRYPDDLDPSHLRLPGVTPIYFAHSRADPLEPESPDNIVLGTNDFAAAYQEPGLVRDLVKALLLRHPVLFLGAQMRDPHFVRAVDEVSRLQAQLDNTYGGRLNRPPRLALIGARPGELDGGEVDPGDRENMRRLAELNIEVEWYDSGNNHSELDGVLRLAAEASGDLSTVGRLRGLLVGGDAA